MGEWVDIPPAVRDRAVALRARAEGIHRMLNSFSAQPHVKAAAKRSLKALRAETLALMREL